MRDLLRPRRALALLVGCAALTGCVGVPGPVPSYATAAGTGIAPTPGAPYSGTCYAGFYVCPLPASLPVGTRCTCPGLGAPSFGVAR